MRGMLHGERPTAAGPRYAARDVRNDPPPLQERMPLLVGGGGEQVTLKLVARYADANNVGGGVDSVRRKEAILVQHCETVGRDPAEIERTTEHRRRDHPRLARPRPNGSRREIFERNGNAKRWTDQPIGTVEDVAEKIAPFLELGYRHLVAGFAVAVRRGVDDPLRDRGQADPRARLARPPGADSERRRRPVVDRHGHPAGRRRRLRPRPVAGGLGAVAAGRHVAPAPAARP